MASAFRRGSRARLVAALLVAGCATRATAAENPPPNTTAPLNWLTVYSLTVAELQDLQAQPDAEQRRRLDILVAAHPDELALRVLRIAAEFHLSDVAAVVSDSEFVLRNPAVPSGSRHLVLEMECEALVKLQRFEEAEAAASRALEIDPSDTGPLLTRGWARHFLHKDELALADLDQGLTIDPSVEIGYFRRATVLRDLGKFEPAAKDYQRAIELMPDDGLIHQGYGVLLYRTHELARALAQFDIAARLMPSDAFALVWRARTNLALGHPDAAAADEKRLNGLALPNAEVADAHNELADILADEGDTEEAARHYRLALALEFDPVVASNLSRVQWYAGQFSQALALYRDHAATPFGKASQYRPLWLYVIRGRANPADEPAAKAELAQSWKAHQPHAWTDTLADMLLGRTTLEAALAEADAAPTDELRAGNRCEASFYAAEQWVIVGQDARAAPLFEQAQRVCPDGFYEGQALVVERRLLKDRSSAH